jgi:integrase
VFDNQALRGKRDYAIVAVLLGCGLRRGEAAALAVESLQQPEEHWVIADLVGKGGHVRTVPVPTWVKAAVDNWVTAAGVTTGPIFRPIDKAQRMGKSGFSPKVIWGVVRPDVRNVVWKILLHTIVGAHAPVCAIKPAGNLSRSSSCWVM